MVEVAKRIKVTGRVQGVGFRAWTESRAEALGLTGWVRNEPDGDVSVLLAGDQEAVERMLENLWQGPAGSTVAEVAAEPCEPPRHVSRFEIRR